MMIGYCICVYCMYLYMYTKDSLTTLGQVAIEELIVYMYSFMYICKQYSLTTLGQVAIEELLGEILALNKGLALKVGALPMSLYIH
jgi:hypothetical protein